MTERDASDRSDDRPGVLIVDRREDVRRTYTEWLDGYQVTTASGGEEALEAVSYSVDVAVVDRRTERGDDVSLLSRLDSMPSLGVVLLTASSPDLEGARFDAFVKKPIRADDLRDAVDFLLSGIQVRGGTPAEIGSSSSDSEASERLAESTIDEVNAHIGTINSDLDSMIDDLNRRVGDDSEDGSASTAEPDESSTSSPGSGPATERRENGSRSPTEQEANDSRSPTERRESRPRSAQRDVGKHRSSEDRDGGSSDASDGQDADSVSLSDDPVTPSTDSEEDGLDDGDSSPVEWQDVGEDDEEGDDDSPAVDWEDV